MNQPSALFGDLKKGPKISEISLADVRPDPRQPRKSFNTEQLKELADSIEQHGQIQPIVVRKDPESTGKFLITAGERRYRALELLRRDTVQALVRDDTNAQVIAIIENLQRVDLAPMEEAEAVAQLIEDQGLNQNSAAKLLGKKRNSINALLSLIKLPAGIRAEATEVGVTRSILVELAQISDDELLTKLWTKAKAGSLTVKECRSAREVKNKASNKSGARRRAPAETALDRLERAIGAVQALKKLSDEDRVKIRDAISRLDDIIIISPELETDAIGLARPKGFKDFAGAVGVWEEVRDFPKMDRTGNRWLDWQDKHDRLLVSVREAAERIAKFRKEHSDATIEQNYRADDQTILELVATYPPDDDRHDQRFVYQARKP